ncbi:cholesterol side-chain cleavage enzyme, mitochondrial [Taeniopygia guttata]|uniref:Cholesterol side-chain cleavage enzyme, mitochondrial n=1 Tax=Taeniopygia guttata TaxID=59729 RepID=Q6GVK8_TAEGU|nr:cholesterol side-chain cleavage enzyme, mitochondrial [Taeniopygia guttata]AAT46359.1 mitochondrial cytochrome P450 chlolesterol side chain cleavage [Taeniopygia guttata]
MLARVVTKPGALRGCPRGAAARCRRLGGAGGAVPSAPRPFNQVPGEWRAGWLNLYRFWREGGLSALHLSMAQKFRRFGPIYREKLGVHETVNIISPGDAATLFQAEGALPERFRVPPWVAYRDFRNKPYGVLLKTGEAWRSDRLLLNQEALAPAAVAAFVPLLSAVGEDFVRRARAQARHSGHGCWTGDFSHELFRFALESVCHVLYGQRLGLLQDFVQPEAQRFIEAVARMFHTTAPMLYLPPALLRRLRSRTWREHVHAWDAIFCQADKCIQNVYRDLRLQRKSSQEYMGILGNLILRDKLPLDDIRASVTEMMAGGVDTTSMTLQWAMLELARAPGVQEQLRAEVLAAKREAGGDREKMLKSTRLLKATIKETLRLHPVAVTLQRYTTHEVILQDYRIPPGTLVQVGLYAMGRDPDVFPRPERFRPQRWLAAGPKPFLGLGFGFGPRQCLGRRIAELEMQLFLMHILENFKIETMRAVEIGTKFDLILIPDQPIQLTLRPLDGQP